jgi:hypothetical protein
VQPNAAGVCAVLSTPRGLVLETDRVHRDDDGLRELIREVGEAGGRVGIDVPLGWPRAFVDALAGLPDTVAFVEHATTGAFPFEALRYRPTDVWIRDLRLTGPTGRPVRPMTVSTDRLGAATMRWQAIRHGLPPDLVAATVVEVHPVAARAIWGLPRGEEQPAPGRFRLELVRSRPPRQVERAGGTDLNEHEQDAVVAALVAAAHFAVEGVCRHGDEPCTAAEEGCTFLPSEGSRPGFAAAAAALGRRRARPL